MRTTFNGFRVPESTLWPALRLLRRTYLREHRWLKHAREVAPQLALRDGPTRRRVNTLSGQIALEVPARLDLIVARVGESYLIRPTWDPWFDGEGAAHFDGLGPERITFDGDLATDHGEVARAVAAFYDSYRAGEYLLQPVLTREGVIGVLNGAASE